MRIDELPKSDRIEDRRGGLSGIPGGRGGLGIGTIVVLGLIGWALGIDPRVLIQGAETISGNDQIGCWPDNEHRRSVRCHGPVRFRGPRQYASTVDNDLCSSRKAIRAANSGDVFRSNQVGLRRGPGCYGSVLLPNRPEGLSRHKFLPGPGTALRRLRCRQQNLPVLTGLCDCP